MNLHVAVVNRHPLDAVGGSELQCDLFARGLVERGHRITYVALDAAPEASSTEAEAGAQVSTTNLPYLLVRLPRARTEPTAIAAAVRDAGADAVYWRYGRRHLAEVTARLDPVPVVLAVAHVDDVSRWPTGPVDRRSPRTVLADVRRRLAHRRSWRGATRVAAVAAQREDFLRRLPARRQVHVPNVVDPTAVPFDWPRPYVAWVANLKARKRPERLVPLARALAAVGVDLLVAGALQDERYRSLTLADPDVPTLHPLGALAPDRAAGLIAGARTLAVTARPEGLSNAMIQAWWHGVPTVSLDYNPDGTITGKGLGAVCGGDVDRFHAEVVRHATDADVRRSAGERAERHARERFDMGRNVATLEALLGDVVRDASAG